MPEKIFEMDPVTYRQVVKNAKSIFEMAQNFGGDISNLTKWLGETKENIIKITEEVNEVTETVDDIKEKIDPLIDPDTEPIDPGVIGQGDVRGKLPNLNVIGNHALDDALTANYKPSAYQRLVTYEIKNCAAIGLSEIPAITVDKCLVITTVPSAQNLSINAFQTANVNDGLVYSRVAIDNETWGDWKSGTIGGAPAEIVSPTQPSDQSEGEYWLEPIEGSEWKEPEPVETQPVEPEPVNPETPEESPEPSEDTTE